MLLLMLCQSYFKSGSLNQLSIKKRIQGILDTRRSYTSTIQVKHAFEKSEMTFTLWLQRVKSESRKIFQRNFSVAASRGSLNLFDADVVCQTSTPAVQIWPATSFYAAEWVCLLLCVEYMLQHSCGGLQPRDSIPVAQHSNSVQIRMRKHGDKIKLKGDIFSKSVF